MLNLFLLDDLIQRALSEDIGTGDITTQAVVPSGKTITGRFIARQGGIVCGITLAQRVFYLLDQAISFAPLVEDGDTVHQGLNIARISGPAHGILSGERLALNFMQRLSGISTLTAQCVGQVSHTRTRITDTRKTTPGLRVLEKYAVRMGGAVNHRMSLSDGVLIKDNHIRAAGGIVNAVNAARKHAPHTLKIEVEAESIGQVVEALEAGADIIMLDNMGLEEMRQAVQLCSTRALTEASGNMDQRNLAEVAATGVDFISIGALTHSVKALDISLKFD